MDVDEREEALEKLPYSSRVAFAARLGERALAEARSVRPELVGSYPSLDRGVELVWRHAIKGDVDFENDAADVHENASKLIPETEDDVVPDQALRFASQAICIGLSTILWPETSGNYAVTAGEAMISLVGIVYDSDKVEDKEGQWQDKAVKLLSAWGKKPPTRTMFNKLHEYDRPPVSESYLSGDEE